MQTFRHSQKYSFRTSAVARPSHVRSIELHRVAAVLLTAMLFLLGATDVYGQAAFQLSKNADFSTEDRVFDASDMLYMRVSAPGVDFTSLDENEFRLRPESGGDGVEGTFTNNFDGSYEASISLDILDPSKSQWKWKAEIEDDANQKFSVKVNLQIGDAASADSSGSDPQGEDHGDDSESDDSNSEDSSEIEASGIIDALYPDSISVAGTTFLVDSTTVVLNSDGDVIAFDELSIGSDAEIHGIMDADGNAFATEIKIEDENDDEVELTGTVEDLGSDFITVAGTTFSVDSTTVILDGNRDPIELADLSTGILVEIRGAVGSNGQLHATRIKVEERVENEIEVTGVIEAVSSDSISVQGLTFRILDTTQILDDNGFPISVDDLAEGQTVEIKGDLLPGNDLVALRIKQENADDQEIELTGPIDSVSADSLIVTGVVFLVDGTTDVLDHDGTPITLSDLSAGQTVEVKGVIQTDGSIFATRVEIEDVSVMTGAVSTATPTRMTVSGTVFHLDVNTLVLGADNQVLTLSDVTSARTAEIRAVQRAAGPLATKVKILSSAAVTANEPGRESLPRSFTLSGNYPNPFNPSTTISFELDGTANGSLATLTIYDILGRRVRTLLNASELTAGSYRYQWDGTSDSGRPAASGMYLYRLQIGDQIQARTMTLLK